MNIARYILAFMALASVTVVSGCEPIEESGTDSVALLDSKEELNIEGRDFVSEASLWVNLMPPVPPEGPDLNILVKIIATDGDNFPDDYTADCAWLLQGENEFFVEFDEEKPRGLSGNNALELVGRTKEKLDPEVPVDVVTKVVTAAGEKFYLRASGQTITITR